MTTTGTLSNGLRWVLAPDPTARTISVQLLSPGGSRVEPEGKRGLAHLIEHLFFDGTTTATAAELIAPLAAHGGELNAYTTNDMVVYYCKVLPPQLELVLATLSDLFFHSLFTPEDIEREKEIVLQEIALRTADLGATLSLVLLPQYAWKDTAAAVPVGGYEEDLRALTQQDVITFVSKYYRPDQVVLSLAGKLPAVNLVKRLLEEYFNLEVATLPPTPRSFVTELPQSEAQTYTLMTNAPEAVLAFAFPYETKGLSPFIGIFQHLLFDAMNSRLYTRLRTELGLTYTITPLCSELRDVGIFGFMFALPNEDEALETAIDEVLSTLELLQEETVSVEELAQAQSSLTAVGQLALEDTMTLAGYYGSQILFGDALIPYELNLQAVQRITPVEVQAAAQALFRPDRLNLGVFR